MTIDKAKEYIATQMQFGSGYNRHSIRLILLDVQKEYGQQGVDILIKSFNLDQKIGLPLGKEIKI